MPPSLPWPFAIFGEIDHDVYNVKSDVHALAAQNSSGNPSVARMIFALRGSQLSLRYASVYMDGMLTKHDALIR
jgi:hypothetical protein